MAKLGTEKKPAIVRVQNEHRGEEIASIFDKNGWKFILGIESDKPQMFALMLSPCNHSLPEPTKTKDYDKKPKIIAG